MTTPMVRSLLAACALFARGAAGTGPRSVAAVEAFHTFMSNFSRSYQRGSGEYQKRLALFAQRADAVAAQNLRPKRLWTAAINPLSDRTEDELAQLRGWRGGATPSSSSSSASSFLAQRNGKALLTQLGGRTLPQEFLNWTALPAAQEVMDQGSCGSCWAVASSSVLKLHMQIHNPGSRRGFSTQELVNCVPNPHKCGGSGGCEGATVELAFDWALSHGLHDETDVPYSAADGACPDRGLLQLSDGGTARVGLHRARKGAHGQEFGMFGWERLPENGYEQLLRAVVELGPVGVSVAAHAWASYGSGVFDGCSRDAVIDHAVVLMGYGQDVNSGAAFYLIRNSWGPSWGEAGQIRLLRSDADGEECGVDRQPELGTACEGGPKEVKVCGMCGVLYDSAVPHFRGLQA